MSPRLWSQRELKEQLQKTNLQSDSQEKIINSLSSIYKSGTLVETFDQLAKIIEICNEAQQKNKENFATNEVLNELQKQAISFINIITNTSSDKQAYEAIADRNQKKLIAPSYLPNASGLLPQPKPEQERKQYARKVVQEGVLNVARGKIKPMGESARKTDQEFQTKYFDEVEREKYRVIKKHSLMQNSFKCLRFIPYWHPFYIPFPYNCWHITWLC